MNKTFEFQGKTLEPGDQPYFIAEMSANHNKDLDLARDIIHAAAESGADAMKLQTFKPETMTIDSDREEFRVDEGTEWAGQSLYDLYEEAYLPWDWHEELFEEAEELGLDCFSTAYDDTALDFLENLGVPVHKIASFEIVDLPLVKKMAETRKPIIMSTGMADLGEIEDAVRTAREHGCEDLLLMHCTSAYPAPASDARLETISHLSEAFGVPVGLSDHTEGTAIPIAAVSQGACMIEKHFCLSRDIDTPDSSFSLEPAEFKRMVEEVSTAYSALGGVNYCLTESEESTVKLRRSLFVTEDVQEGGRVTEENVGRLRPGHGLSPRYYDDILGKEFRRDVEQGTPIQWDLVR